MCFTLLHLIKVTLFLLINSKKSHRYSLIKVLFLLIFTNFFRCHSYFKCYFYFFIPKCCCKFPHSSFYRQWATLLTCYASWLAPFCQKGSTSNPRPPVPRQGVQECEECGTVPWTAFANILKAIPGL